MDAADLPDDFPASYGTAEDELRIEDHFRPPIRGTGSPVAHSRPTGAAADQPGRRSIDVEFIRRPPERTRRRRHPAIVAGVLALAAAAATGIVVESSAFDQPQSHSTARIGQPGVTQVAQLPAIDPHRPSDVGALLKGHGPRAHAARAQQVKHARASTQHRAQAQPRRGAKHPAHKPSSTSSGESTPASPVSATEQAPTQTTSFEPAPVPPPAQSEPSETTPSAPVSGSSSPSSGSSSDPVSRFNPASAAVGNGPPAPGAPPPP